MCPCVEWVVEKNFWQLKIHRSTNINRNECPLLYLFMLIIYKLQSKYKIEKFHGMLWKQAKLMARKGTTWMKRHIRRITDAGTCFCKKTENVVQSLPTKKLKAVRDPWNCCWKPALMTYKVWTPKADILTCLRNKSSWQLSTYNTSSPSHRSSKKLYIKFSTDISTTPMSPILSVAASRCISLVCWSARVQGAEKICSAVWCFFLHACVWMDE